MERLKKILIKPGISIRQALKHMDTYGEKTIFVVDDSGRLQGAVTDGDIRRWILKGGSLAHPISKVMHRDSILLQEGFSKEEAKDIMTEKIIDCIPVVSKNKKIVSAVWWTDLFEKKPIQTTFSDVPIVLMAGGEGKRLYPFTKVLPKPLMLVGEKTILEMIIEKFAEYGSSHFYLSVNYKSNLIKAYLDDLNGGHKIHYVKEEKPLGTAGGLYYMKKDLKNTFCVSNCDIVIEADLSDILNFHKVAGNIVTLVGSMKHYTIPYGVCKLGKNEKLSKIDEKPEYDFLVNTGMYLLEPEALKMIPKNKMFHMTDLINQCLKKKEKVGVYPISEKSWLDMGQWEEYKEMMKRFGV